MVYECSNLKNSTSFPLFLKAFYSTAVVSVNWVARLQTSARNLTRSFEINKFIPSLDKNARITYL